MRYLLVVLSTLLLPLSVAHGEISVSIGVNMPMYPRLVQVPDYPVYYAPQAESNYFFYDGVYWVFAGGDWQASEWYNGPWQLVGADDVPLYLLRVPVRYYRQPPDFFRGWPGDAPPRWGLHWGRDWEGRRVGWDKWDRHTAPHAAPLPTYQRKYAGIRYPREPGQRISIRTGKYGYQPREAVSRQHFSQPQGNGQENRATSKDKAKKDKAKGRGRGK